MGTEWPKKKLSELVSKITKGTTPSKKDGGFACAGVNFIKAECVTLSGRIDETKFAFVSESVHERYSRSQLAENDLLFSMAGVILGKTALVEKKHLPANTNQALALIRAVPENVIPRYLHYFLRQSSVFHFVNNSTSQSAQPNINLREIGNLDIDLPPLPEQKAIAHILGSLDDKIECNRKMNETLEAMAQALFKSWFVDFDPVLDNALAAGNPIPEALAVRAEMRREVMAQGRANREIAKAFPAAFQFTEELGWIPEGWEVTNLGKMALFKNGKKRSDITNGSIPVFGSNGIIGHSNTYNREDAIIIGRVGTYCGSLHYCMSKFWATDNTITGEMVTKESNHFLLKILSTANLNDRRGGSGQPLLNQSILNSVLVAKPPPSSISIYSRYARIFRNRFFANNINTKQITNLRDTLLPKLISGELRVPEAAKMAEEALT